MENQKSGFMGNLERSIKLGKMFPSTETGSVRRIKEEDGATFFKVEIGVVVDTNFPTKAGNTTTAMIIVPLDGGKDFPTSWGKVQMNGIPPFIYQGRGASMVFTSLNTNGDVVKKNTSRRSASAEIDEIKKQLAAIAAMLAAK
jgi:hypothetical protein